MWSQWNGTGRKIQNGNKMGEGKTSVCRHWRVVETRAQADHCYQMRFLSGDGSDVKKLLLCDGKKHGIWASGREMDEKSQLLSLETAEAGLWIGVSWDKWEFAPSLVPTPLRMKGTGRRCGFPLGWSGALCCPMSPSRPHPSPLVTIPSSLCWAPSLGCHFVPKNKDGKSTVNASSQGRWWIQPTQLIILIEGPGSVKGNKCGIIISLVEVTTVNLLAGNWNLMFF